MKVKSKNNSNNSMTRVPGARVMRFVMAACLLGSITNPAIADETPTQAVSQAVSSEPLDEIVIKNPGNPGLISLNADSISVSAEELNDQRAMAKIEIDSIFINDQKLDGTVSNNSAINTISGGNTIGGQSFGNASGFVSSIQNTGNNVLIQSATIVNVAIEE